MNKLAENIDIQLKIKADPTYYGKTMENGCTERVRFLNADLRGRKAGVDLHRARCYTKIYRDHAELDKYMKRALAIKETMTTMKLTYTDGELIVGLATEKPYAHAFQPEIDTTWVAEEGGLQALRTREDNRFFATDEEVGEFENEIYPFWKDKTAWAKWRGELPKDVYDKIVGTGFSAPGFPVNCYGSHMTMNWEEIFANGTNYYKEIALKKLEEYDFNDPKQLEKNMFYRAVVVMLEAIEEYAHRWASYLRELAEQKPERKEELLNLADICDNVPMNQARTFHEVLQSYWFCFNVLQNDGTGLLLGFGRMDQILQPYYEREVAAGTLTKDLAMELIECFYIKTNNTLFFTDAATSKFFQGTAVMQNVITGGVDRYGNDNSNEMSYLLVDAFIDAHCLQPAMCCRVNSNSSDKWLNKILDLVEAGMGYPSIFNDDTAIAAMKRYGWDEADANEWIATGCEEIGKTGHYTWGPGQYINLAMAIDMAFTGGKKREGVNMGRCGEQLSKDTGDCTGFETYEEFETAVLTHVKEQIDLIYIADQHLMNVYQEYPLMVQSVLADSGLERGLAYFSGGGYSSSYPGYVGVGIPDMIDSLAAVKKLVYDDKVITMAELRDALAANFVGYEDIYQMCKNAPKYGNDDLSVDLVGKHAMEWIADEIIAHPGVFAKYDPDQETAATRHQRGLALVPQSGCVPHGSVVGALPSGRKSMESLGDSCSPYPGADVNGPTASLKSVARQSHEKFHGTITNMYITRDVLETPEGRQRTIDMVHAAFEEGVGQLQFNIMDKEVLEDAQEHPDDYPTLIVRVTGYSAYFVELDRNLQNQIMKRTVHQV